jgi:hypothetical protein
LRSSVPSFFLATCSISTTRASRRPPGPSRRPCP